MSIGNKKTFEERADMHLRILQEIHDTYRKKNSDYGGSFTNLYRKFGLVSPVIKLYDKLTRLESLINKDIEVVDESIEDTLLDMANYAIMTALEMRIDNGYYDNVNCANFDYSKLPKVVAVDFDGTLVQGAEFPEIGELNVDLTNELISGKYKDWKKILYTHRCGHTLDMILPFLKDLEISHGLKFDAINDNIQEVKDKLHGGPIKKVWFDEFIDDKARNMESIPIIIETDISEFMNFDVNNNNNKKEEKKGKIKNEK